MPFKIVRSDITLMKTDAIVNTANPEPVYAGGTDCAVYEAAGAERLLEERRKIGPMQPGQAAVTPGFALPARYIIHTVGPVWIDGLHNEEEILARCCRSCLQAAKKHHCRSIAFPVISAGVNGFPQEKALQIELAVFSEFLMQEEMQIWLVVFGSDTLALSQKLTDDIDSFVDENYVQEKLQQEYMMDLLQPNLAYGRPSEEYPPRISMAGSLRERSRPDRVGRGRRSEENLEEAEACQEMAVPFEAKRQPYSQAMPDVLCAAEPKLRRSLDDVLRETEETFQQHLFRLIRERGLTNAEVYRRANLQKQLFAKIKANENYAPRKSTALALCLALHLNLDETKDLIGRAGYTLSRSSRFDLVIWYFIDREVYDIPLIDTALYEHSLPTLSTY